MQFSSGVITLGGSSLGGNNLGNNYPEGNCLGAIFFGGNYCPGAITFGGNCLEGNHLRTIFAKVPPHMFHIETIRN